MAEVSIVRPLDDVSGAEGLTISALDAIDRNLWASARASASSALCISPGFIPALLLTSALRNAVPGPGDLPAEEALEIARAEIGEKKLLAKSFCEFLSSQQDASASRLFLQGLWQTMIEQNFSEGARWYHLAGARGLAIAQVGSLRSHTPAFESSHDLLQFFSAGQYRAAAISGLAEAQHNLGICLENGLGAVVNLAEAAEFYRRAAEQGHPAAMFDFGRCHESGRGVPASIEKAIFWYRESAKQGHSDAQCNLAFCLQQQRKDAEAVRWFRASSNIEAVFRFGLCLELGKGVTANMKQAVTVFRRAAESGHAGAQFELGTHLMKGEWVKQDPCQAASWFRMAADQGHAAAQMSLGICFETGTGVQKNAGEATQWYLKAARQGIPEAQFNLGRCLCFTDSSAAARWLRLAAERGVTDAQYLIGICLATGKGVEANLEEAKRFLQEAATKGHADAAFSLGVCFTRSGDETNSAKWWSVAALRGHRVAQLNMGVCLETGRGTAADIEQAARWFHQAADQQFPAANNNFGILQWTGLGVCRDEREAMARLRLAAEAGVPEAAFNLATILSRSTNQKDRDESPRWFQTATRLGISLDP